MSSGTKATNTNEGINNPKIEKAGIVTSDSLAGESLNSGGSFGAGNHPAAMSQPSSSTTTNNTDTSGATILQAASDAEARQALEDWNEEAQLNAARGLSAGNDVGEPAPPTSSYLATSSAQGSSANPSGTFTGQAPHGKNISEGGFDSNAPNASFNNEVGGKNDPARQAVNDMQRNAQQSAGDAGLPKQKGVSNDGQFDVLKDTSA
ncbi:unnamed protein product [Aureobasidium uvarum]|uniref:Uncharacterized protein n=1 Tax=Aureobasidium uvarum TaxID=2773716 RepID=A0A9N8PVY6_9PEZI|nr:unnamed protein product [Aureobasidium uvarum]